MSENQIEGVYPEHGVPIHRTEPRRKRLVITRPVRPSFQRGTDPALRQNRKAVSQLTTRSERRSIAFSGCPVAVGRSGTNVAEWNATLVAMSPRVMLHYAGAGDSTLVQRGSLAAFSSTPPTKD